MALFISPSRMGKADDSKAVKEAASKRKVGAPVKATGNSLLDRITRARQLANKVLGSKKDRFELVQDEQRLIEYIDHCIANRAMALDTEISSLDRIEGKAAGVNLYTPGEKAIYVPTGHISHMTRMPIPGQLSVEFVNAQLQRLVDSKVGVVYHNAKFDIHVCYWHYEVEFGQPLWDTYLASNLLNENEEHNLKVLHNKYCSDGNAEVAKFNDLFDGIEFNLIPLDVAYLYACNDALETWELYEFQKPFLDGGEICKKKGLERVSKVLHEIELPLIPVIYTMEKVGVTIDTAYAAELRTKYSGYLEEAMQAVATEIDACRELIDNFCQDEPQKASKLSNPINIGSPTQVAILLYDILGLENKDKEKPRGTGEEIIAQLDHPVCKAILRYREISKLLSTYIEAIPAQIKKRTGKLHTSFNQYGAKTGRFSSSDPNLQNIPSHNKDIRKMFAASEGYVLIGSDYSQQEPRCLAYMSQDAAMLKAYAENKDLYGIIASKIYKMPYEECLEFLPDGTTNPAGKKRRNSVKPVLLGIMYGRGAASVAEVMGVSKKEAEKIIEDFFTEFPGVADFVLDTQEMAATEGYVETATGRKRRLPDMMLDKYEFTPMQSAKSSSFNPLFDEDEEEFDNTYVPDHIISKYSALLDKAWGREQKQKVKDKLLEEGYKVSDNGGKIADAQRQCVNSVIQGSSADITKTAMIEIHSDSALQSLGFRLLLTVHDELIGEGPYENKDAIAERLQQVMIHAAKKVVDVPMSCDVEITQRWYGESVA